MTKFFLLVVLLGTTGVRAQESPNMFASRQEAEDAYRAGNYTYYQPRVFHGYGRNPVDGITRTAEPMSADAIVEMPVTMAERVEIKWVILPGGTFLRWQRGRMGQKTPYAHDACGNKIFSYFPVSEESTKSEEVSIPPSKPTFSAPSVPISTADPDVSVENHFYGKEEDNFWESPWPFIIIGGAAVVATIIIVGNGGEEEQAAPIVRYSDGDTGPPSDGKNRFRYRDIGIGASISF